MSRAVKRFTKPTRPVPTITNEDNFPAYERPLEEKYVQMLMTNVMGDTFYVDKNELADRSAIVHDEMLKADADFAAKALVYARNFGYMRLQPIYGLAKLASADGGLFEEVFDKVVRTPNDVRDFLVILKSLRGGEGGRRVKRTIGRWMINRLNEYWTIKYGSAEKQGYSIKDMLITVHPRAGRKVPLFDYLMGRDEVDLSELPQIQAFEALKKAKTDEEKIKSIVDGRLPHEVATTFAGSSTVVWEAILPQLPIFALLRNLATLERHGVFANKENVNLVVKKLSDPKVIQKSMILPFRFAEAIKHVNDARVSDALREALDLSFENVPSIEGRTAVCLDISGSMGPGYHQEIKGCPPEGFIRIASLFGICLLRKANLDGSLLLFDTSVVPFKVSAKDSILSQAERIVTRGGTDCGIPVRHLIDTKDFVDQIVMITDEQQNTGSRFLTMLDEYRAKVNRKVKTFILNVTPYEGAMVPPQKDVYYSYGWSDQVLKFVSFASKGWGDMVKVIKSGKYRVESEEA